MLIAIAQAAVSSGVVMRLEEAGMIMVADYANDAWLTLSLSLAHLFLENRLRFAVVGPRLLHYAPKGKGSF